MENNNEIMNEDVIETTEEIVKASSRNGLGKVATIGLAMTAGGLACKFIVEPAWARFKEWRKNRRMILVNRDKENDSEEIIVEDSKE